jgi:hypothetical protein
MASGKLLASRASRTHRRRALVVVGLIGLHARRGQIASGDGAEKLTGGEGAKRDRGKDCGDGCPFDFSERLRL